MTLKNNEFVKIEYTGRLKDTKEVFDTTAEETAKKEKIFNSKVEYGPIVVCIGQNQVIPGIDDALLNSDVKQTLNLDILPEKAFGKKNAKLLKLVPSKIFKSQKIQPFIGLQVQIDNIPGTIRSISGGRILVDFNHPLSGRELLYEIKIGEKITDMSEKVKSYFEITLGVKNSNVKIIGDKVEIEMELPKEVKIMITDKIKSIIPEIRTIEFVSKPKQINKHEQKTQ